MDEPTHDQYRAAAKARGLDENNFDFDDEPRVSESNDGAYVQVWMWINKEEVKP